MFRRVLVATDLSEASFDAVDEALHYAKRDGARLAVCHVVPNLLPIQPFFPQLGVAGALDAAKLETEAERAVAAEFSRRTGLADGLFDVLVETGSDAASIVRRADAWGADLVVVGSHGRTGFRRALLGSVSERVVRTAHSAVLVARPGATKGGPVVVATDISDPSVEAIRVAKTEADARGVPLVLVHAFYFPVDPIGYGYLSPFGVVSTPPDPKAVESLREAATAALATAAEAAGVTGAKRLVVEGLPAPAIVAAAESEGAGLLVVATHGRTGLARVAIGSVAESVVRHASCPVLAVRQKA